MDSSTGSSQDRFDHDVVDHDDFQYPLEEEQTPGRWVAWRRLLSHLRRRRSLLITDAQMSPGQHRRHREIWYGILQFLRVPSLLGAGGLVLYHHWTLAALTVAVTFPLPWVAVVIGNSQGPRKDSRQRNTYKPGLARAQRAYYEQQALAVPRPQPGLLPGTAKSADAPARPASAADAMFGPGSASARQWQALESPHD
ncbi:DUF3099 domain-containing protein [Corynebacterium lizhenjunii]|uniref:DUF3099 domain-containing protein n=1 Tax=Corynebacterium lizhenjunii TaxID=2709394 RepID=A0A7T0KD75_9CORY|nr:DUF3099 domain-containing protein [Corynebacterium lizhenjunii]QPK78329.1 DUF3099 domain-containing protein [Corynebacterium lizhenjunii]